MARRTVYMDYAAATPVESAVLKAVQPYYSEKFYNPSANYLAAKAVKDDILAAKKSIGAHIGARHSEIIHTSGGTESNNLAICGVMDLFPGKKVLVSSIEHESALNPAEKYNHGLIPVDKDGIIDLNILENMINDDVVLISVMLANNEVGTVQPIRKIAEIIRRTRKSRRNKKIDLPFYLHTDACQAPCYLDIDTNRLGIDLMTLNGGKIYAPKQSGILFVNTGTMLKPQILGGGQQRGLRSGTENPVSVIAFAKALEIAASKKQAESARLQELRENFVGGLKKINPEIIINGHPKKRLPHIVHATFPGADNERLLFQLDDMGVLAASGSACSASSDEPSHVLEAMGVADKAARSSLRFSIGRDTSSADIKYALDCLGSLLA